MECVDLKNEWKLWFHSINDNNWNKSSYKQLFSLKDLFDTNLMMNIFKQNHYQNGMFFLMKEDID